MRTDTLAVSSAMLTLWHNVNSLRDHRSIGIVGGRAHGNRSRAAARARIVRRDF
jgi:hypothetical protein